MSASADPYHPAVCFLNRHGQRTPHPAHFVIPHFAWALVHKWYEDQFPWYKTTEAHWRYNHNYYQVHSFNSPEFYLHGTHEKLSKFMYHFLCRTAPETTDLVVRSSRHWVDAYDRQKPKSKIEKRTCNTFALVMPHQHMFRKKVDTRTAEYRATEKAKKQQKTQRFQNNWP